MPKKSQFLKFNTIKKYIKAKKMRSSDDAVKTLIKAFDSIIGSVIKDAKKLAKKDKRDTVMKEDIIPALQKHLGRKHLTWQETAKQIIRQNPTDLGKISKVINDYIERGKKK